MTPEKDVSDYEQMIEHFRQQKEQSKKQADAARGTVVSFLRQMGVESVTVEFDGSGDSGQIERVDYSPEQSEGFGDTEVPGTEHETSEWTGSGYRKVTRDSTIRDLIEMLCYKILSFEHGGWEINEGSYGDFEIDVNNDTISLTYNQRVESVDTSYEEY